MLGVAALALALVMGAPPAGQPGAAGAASPGVTAISAGEIHSCAVKADGSAWCWGDNRSGQLGNGTAGPNMEQLNPGRVLRSSSSLTDAASISAGRFHSCAVTSGGAPWCWGENEYGHVGVGSTTDQLRAVQVRQGKSALTGVSAISAGVDHTCARKTDGSAWCWGRNERGQLGDGTTTNRLKAVQVRDAKGNLKNVSAISAGEQHTCARKTDGSAWCWGDASGGQVGDGTTGDANGRRLLPTRVRDADNPLTGVTLVSGGFVHSCAATADGQAWCWGRNSYGQLGDGTTGGADKQRTYAAPVVWEGGG